MGIRNININILTGGIICLLAALCAPAPTDATHIVRGTVRDAGTGAPLGAATVHVVGTYRATIANDEGEYALKVSALPATVRVISIGYRTLELPVDPDSPTLDFNLQATPYQLPEIVVYPEFGAELMQKVIDRKAEWMPRIKGYSAEVYTRRSIQRTGDIVELHETVSDVFWDRELGIREIVTSRRQTRNSETDEYIPALAGMVNLYHDDIDFLQADLMGVTHPDALDHYDFTLAGRRKVDDQVVYDLDVKPKSRLHSGFFGTVSILDGEFALLEVDLAPTRPTLASVVSMPLIEGLSLSYRQQFRSFNGLWLPVDYRMDFEIEIGMIGLQFPLIGMEQVTRFADYKVVTEPVPDAGIAMGTAAPDPIQTTEKIGETEPVLPITETDTSASVPDVARADRIAIPQSTAGARRAALRDSLFASEQTMRVDSAAVAADTAFTRFADPVPMTAREAAALDTISADFSAERAFRPSGFMTRFMDFEEEEESREGGGSIQIGTGGTQVERGAGRKLLAGFEAAARFNRVEEAQFGLSHVRTLPGGFALSGAAGFSSGLRRWNFDLAGRRDWDLAPGWLSLHAGYARGGGSHYESDTYPILLNSVQALLGEDDYFDYYWVDGVGVDLNYLPGRYQSKIRLGWRAEEHSSLTSTTEFDLFDRRPLRPNPAVDEGRMHRIELEIEVGGDYTGFGIAPNRRLELSVEHSAEWLGSDFDFTKLHFAVDWHQPTFLRRRWIPNALDLRLVGGLHGGSLPVQRFGALDVGMGPLSPYGALRAVRGHPYIGESYLGLVAEHNFRSAPFELLGLWPLVERGFGLLVHGGYGQTWISAERRAALPIIPRWTKDPHQEFGLSLFLYQIARIDVTRRIDPDDWSVGVSMARFDFD